MANFEEQMRLFEAEVGQGPPRPRPPFMPHNVRPPLGPPPSHPPPRHGMPQPLMKNTAGMQKQYSAPAVISKPATGGSDEDVFSTLLKYEKEVRQEKREKKKTGQAKVTPPPEPKVEMTARPRAADSALYKTATIAAPPVRPGGAPPAASSLAGAGPGGAMLPSALMKPSHISANPTPMVKPGTQVNITTKLFVYFYFGFLYFEASQIVEVSCVTSKYINVNTNFAIFNNLLVYL